ncbi:MAG TPA: response regulator [Nitrospiria bacterium]|nr:response regulator [Nitrospiria bacterium]
MAKKLLVVDSNLAIQKLVEYNLSREKFEVTCLNDGLSALDLLAQIDPDLILADFHLEGISFVRFCEKVKQKQTSKERAILVLVSGTDSYDPNTLVSLGVVDFVKKPLEPKDLIEKLKELSQDAATLIDRAPKPVVPAALDSPPPLPPSQTPVAASPPPSKDQAEIMKIEELLGWSLPGEKPPGEVSQKAEKGIPEIDNETTMIQSRTDVTALPSAPPEPTKESSEVPAVSPPPALEDSEQTVIGLRTPPISPPSTTPEAPADAATPASKVEPPEAPSPPVTLATLEEAFPQLYTSPETIEAPPPTPTVQEAGAQPPPASGGTVSQEMVESLVSKMAREIIEKVAWDVVPSLAETMIKEELDKLKADKPA